MGENEEEIEKEIEEELEEEIEEEIEDTTEFSSNYDDSTTETYYYNGENEEQISGFKITTAVLVICMFMFVYFVMRQIMNLTKHTPVYQQTENLDFKKNEKALLV